MFAAASARFASPSRIAACAAAWSPSAFASRCSTSAFASRALEASPICDSAPSRYSSEPESRPDSHTAMFGSPLRYICVATVAAVRRAVLAAPAAAVVCRCSRSYTCCAAWSRCSAAVAAAAFCRAIVPRRAASCSRPSRAFWMTATSPAFSFTFFFAACTCAQVGSSACAAVGPRPTPIVARPRTSATADTLRRLDRIAPG